MSVAGQGKRVLLVEDDEAIAEVVTLTLDESGYVVDHVFTVADASSHVAGERTPAVILLDLALPEVSGLSLLRACRESDLLASLPIVLMTGWPLPAFDDDCAPDAVLTKPFDIDNLTFTIDRLTRADGRSSVEAMGDAPPALESLW